MSAITVPKAYARYLTSVLGVHRVIVDEASQPMAEIRETIQTQNSGLPQVLVSNDLNKKEQALLSKMMTAIGVENFQVLTSAADKIAGPVLNLGAEGPEKFKTYTLSEMLGSGAEVNQRKKQAWSVLKQFKEAL